jgi:hypothetical protein
MDAEANVYMVFTGFSASTTENMDIEELTLWNDKALERHNMAKKAQERR